MTEQPRPDSPPVFIQSHPVGKDPRSQLYHKYNPLSRIFFCWIDSLFWFGACHTLEHQDLFVHPNEVDTNYLLDKFKKYWAIELRRRNKPYLSVALLKCIWWRLVVSFCLFLLVVLFQIGKALFVGEVTEYLSNECPSTMDTVNAYLSALGLSLFTIFQTIITAVASFVGYKCGLLVRVAVTSAIYDKILSLSQGTVSRLTIGHIVNLASNDVHRFDLALVYVSFLFIGPAFIIVTGAVLYYEIGWVCLIAVAMVIVQIPVQVVLSKLLSHFRLQAAKVTDERVKIMNEVITGIRVIKMYGWENAFHHLVTRIRHHEMMIILKSSVIRAVNLSTYATSLPTIMFTIFTVYAAIGGCITLRKVFVTLSLLSVSRNFSNFLFIAGISHVSEAVVAIKRIQKFLLLEDLDQFMLECKSKHSLKLAPHNLSSVSASKPSESFPAVSVDCLCASWANEKDNLSLQDISFTITKEHPLISVVGLVGAGKSTLLQCLLGELPPISGDINMEGTVAYAGQEPWVFSDTLRENILFGHPYIPDWYNTVIDLCTLDKDISILSDGDLTVVGERGVTLSGGQKARVGLARAVYRKAGIYLLDDPLSAVDAAVSRQIFDKCIKGFLTQSSVVILVTHQLQYVQQCDTVLVLNKGCMSVCGNPSDVLQGSTDVIELLNSRIEEDNFINQLSVRKFSVQDNYMYNKADSTSGPILPNIHCIAEENHDEGLETDITDSTELTEIKLHPHASINKPHPQTIVNQPHPSNISSKESKVKEDRAQGTISFRTYYEYFRVGGGPFFTLVFIPIFILAEVAVVASDWWLAIWAREAGSENSTSSCTTSYSNTTGNATSCTSYSDDRIGVYGGLLLTVWILCIVRTVMFYIILLRAATFLHNKMFISVLRSPVLFFDTNPVGRILNRFSKDIGFLDDLLIFIFCEFLQFLGRFLAIVVTASVAVYHLIPFIVIMVILFIAFRWYYLKTFREIKRLESIARSPLYSHISMTLQGLPTIRAYGKQEQLLKSFYDYQNSHSQAWYLYIVSARWFGLRVDIVCAVFVSLVAFVSIPLANVLDSALIGLALTYIVTLTGLFQYCVRQSAEVESLMVSVERVMNYGKLPSEEIAEGRLSHPPNGWPDKGHMEITDLCYKHSGDGPSVLNNINCTIVSGEKVGIVGRTGAGKSSLIGAFFRLAQPNGSIKIDGVECLSIPLQDLRPRISIIPQDPVLFSGNIRYNLDPFDQYDDENIWTVLKQVQLGGVVESLEGGLEAEVTEGGNNFSVGERQLFCLARALLRHNKILMLDEATANVDLKTDSIIQQVIREYFNECTVLTIAHRLDTVMDSDKIMVLRNGELIEYGEPYQLLCNPESYLLKLVEQTGPEAAERLKQLAFSIHEKLMKQ